MLRQVRLLPECHADNALVSFLVQNKELYRHSRGSEVAADMQAASQDFDIVVGIVDGDKSSKPRYYDSFEFKAEENNVQLWKKPGSEEYLLIIVGEKIGIETFILWNAEQVGISLDTYGFETTAKRLRPKFKSVNIETDPNYLQLLADLRARQAPGFQTLERILNSFTTT